VWPWLVQIGDRRGGFYSYDWIERCVFAGTVHYVERTHSATRIHPELQNPHVGDNNQHRLSRAVHHRQRDHDPRAQPRFRDRHLGVHPPALSEQRTRLLVRERDSGWIRLAVPRRYGLLRAAGASVDYVIAEPLHFAMTRKMMLGLKHRAATQPPG
jgi:hypothetical protein